MKRLISFFIISLCLISNMQAQTKYVVQRGETLESIAQKYGTSAEAIKKAVEESSIKGYDINIDDMNKKPLKFMGMRLTFIAQSRKTRTTF